LGGACVTTKSLDKRRYNTQIRHTKDTREIEAREIEAREIEAREIETREIEARQPTKE